MQKSLLSLQPKSKPKYFCPSSTLQTQYSTIEPQHSDIENIELVSDDDIKMPSCKQQSKNFKPDSVHLEIQLDDGKVEMIFPKINDDPFLLARSFCEKHQLDEEMLSILVQNIRKTIIKMKSNQEVKKQQRFATEPAQYFPRQENPKKCDTNTKNNAINSRNLPDYLKNKEAHEQFINQNTASRNTTSRQNSKKSIIQYTHTPQINSLSKKIFQIKPPYKSTKRQRHNPSDSVRTQSSIRTQPLEDRDSKSKENQLHSVFDYLYEDSRLKEMKKKEKMEIFMKRNCKFKPEINATSRRIAGNQSFEQRLKTSVQKSSEKNIRNRSVISSVQSFKGSLPKMYIKPESSKEKKEPPITYSLKNLTKNTSLISSKPYIASSSKSILSKPTHPSNQTQKLYQNQKQKAFRSIFQLLDDNNDGLISILNINLISGIEQKLIQILFPVLEELEILETELNQNEFCSAIDKLFVGLSTDEKGYLLKYCQRLQKEEKQKQENQFMKPSMTPVSTVIVNQTERSHVSVYEYSKIRQQLKQKKLQQQRILKQRTIMRNCTFHPKTNPKKAIYF